MKVVANMEDPDEIRHIMRHLLNIGRAPPGLDASRMKLDFTPHRIRDGSLPEFCPLSI